MNRITPAPLLRSGLVADAIGSGGLGLLHLAATDVVAARVGAPTALIVDSGLFMLAYATVIAWKSTREALPCRAIQVVVWGNSAWVLGCISLALALPDPKAWALAHLAFQAAAVSGFVALQGLGLARSATARG